MNPIPDTLAVSRREIKYLISLKDRLYLLDALNRLLIPDAYGGYNGYTVRSVYFDSITNEDYRDKKEHADEKKRVRLRVYHPGSPRYRFYFLEYGNRPGCCHRLLPA